MPPSPQTLALGNRALHTTQFFQFLLSAIVFGTFFFYVWYEYLFDTNYRNYDLVTAFFTTLFTLVIATTVILQAIVTITPIITTVLEAIKSVLAAVLWVWLLFDSIFAHRGSERKGKRVLKAGLAGILLVILFFAPLAYARYQERRAREEEGDDEERGEEGPGERTPLLVGAE